VVGAGGVAGIGKGVEGGGEGGGGREEQRRQGLDPARQEALLLRALGAVGVVRGEAFLGQDVEPSEQPQGLVAVEVVDVAAAFLVEQLQDQEAEQGARGGGQPRGGGGRGPAGGGEKRAGRRRRASNGRTRKIPAARLRGVRPGARLRQRASAVATSSGGAGIPGATGRGGRPRAGGAKRGEAARPHVGGGSD